MGKLDNKIAIVTGGNDGIGEATAKLFAEEGATVILFARREEENKRVASEIAAEGHEVMYVTGDVRKPEDVKALFETVSAKYGRVDVLVNVAGIADEHASVNTSTDENWLDNVNTNQSGPFYTTRELIKLMLGRGKAVIVNVASIGGTYSMAGAPYSSAKLGCLALTKHTARYYTSKGIRCNAVCPGPTDTKMIRDMKPGQGADYAGAGGPPPSEGKKPGAGGPPPGAFGTPPIEQAKAILFFACEDSAYVSGQYLVVDNGMCV